MGNFNYALSRISYSQFCSSCLLPNANIKDTDPGGESAGLFQRTEQHKTWTYPDESSSYSITTTDTAAADNTPGRQNLQRLADGDLGLYQLLAGRRV